MAVLFPLSLFANGFTASAPSSTQSPVGGAPGLVADVNASISFALGHLLQSRVDDIARALEEAQRRYNPPRNASSATHTVSRRALRPRHGPPAVPPAPRLPIDGPSVSRRYIGGPRSHAPRSVGGVFTLIGSALKNPFERFTNAVMDVVAVSRDKTVSPQVRETAVNAARGTDLLSGLVPKVRVMQIAGRAITQLGNTLDTRPVDAQQAADDVMALDFRGLTHGNPVQARAAATAPGLDRTAPVTRHAHSDGAPSVHQGHLRKQRPRKRTPLRATQTQHIVYFEIVPNREGPAPSMPVYRTREGRWCTPPFSRYTSPVNEPLPAAGAHGIIRLHGADFAMTHGKLCHVRRQAGGWVVFNPADPALPPIPVRYLAHRQTWQKVMPDRRAENSVLPPPEPDANGFIHLDGQTYIDLRGKLYPVRAHAGTTEPALREYAVSLGPGAFAPNRHGVIKTTAGRFIEVGGRHFPIRWDRDHRTWRVFRPEAPHHLGIPVRHDPATGAWTFRAGVGLRGGGMPLAIDRAVPGHLAEPHKVPVASVPPGGLLTVHGNEVLSTGGLSDCTVLVLLNKLDPRSGVYAQRTMMHVWGSNLETKLELFANSQHRQPGAARAVLDWHGQALPGRSKLIIAFGTRSSRPAGMQMVVSQEVSGRMPIRELIDKIGIDSVEFYHGGSDCDVSAYGEYLSLDGRLYGSRVDSDVVLDD